MKHQTPFESKFTLNPVLSQTQTPHPSILHIEKKGMGLKKFDLMGSPIPFHWNGHANYRTKVGVIATFVAYLALGYIVYHYMGDFIRPGSPRISYRSVPSMTTKSAPINLSEEVMITMAMKRQKADQTIPVTGLQVLCAYDTDIHFVNGTIYGKKENPKLAIKESCPPSKDSDPSPKHESFCLDEQKTGEMKIWGKHETCLDSEGGCQC